MKRFLIPIIVIFALLSFLLVRHFVNLKYTPTHASQVVFEVTAKTQGGNYVNATQNIRDGITQLTSAGGGVLFFGPGKYLVDETIVIPSNITIEGAGAGGVGPTMVILGNNGNLDGQGMALFSIAPGAQNIVIKDVELRSMTPSPNFFPRDDADRIQSENTTGLRIYGNSSSHTQNIKIENVSVADFTYGIDAGSTDNSDPYIENVKIKSLSSTLNYWAVRIKSRYAQNWDVQNLDVVETSTGQSGVLLERTGSMSFLQLSCASTNFDGQHQGALCIDIRERYGPIHLTELHVEGLQEGLRIKTASTQPIYIENSAFGGTVEQQSVIYSFINRYSNVGTDGRLKFINGGVASTLYKCADTFTRGLPYNSEPTVNPSDQYPGLTNVPTGCNFDVTAVSGNYSSGILPFQAFEWVANNQSPSSTILNVKSFGAVGDGVADDTQAFKDALVDNNSVLWSASTVVIPAGTYKISDTIVIPDGISFVGDGNATIQFTATDRPLFQIRAMVGDQIIKQGIGIKGLSLTNADPSHPGQTTTAIDIVGNGFPAIEMGFSNLNITGFYKGINVHNFTGNFDNTQSEFDSNAVRSINFSNNGTAIEFKNQNASNWNIEGINISGMKTGQIGIKVDGGGHIAIRNLNCQGQSSANPAKACAYIARQSGVYIDNLTSTNNQFAFFGEWSIGWQPFPVIIKNSNLRDGFYSAGRMYLLSVANTYADGGSTNPPGSKTAFFNVAGSDDSANNSYPGELSVVTSCGDQFLNSSNVASSTLKFVGLNNAAQVCSFVTPDTTAPTVSITAPIAGATVSGATVNITASATDNIGVAGVQFKLDGANLGSEDTTSPYSITWDTTAVSDGSHVITAVARDAAGNNTTSAAVNVTVNNTIPTVASVSISPNGGTFTTVQTVSLSTTTSGASIYYTIDGSTPTSSSTLYSVPISIASSKTVKAIAVKSGMNDSSISTAAFIINLADTIAPTVSVTAPTTGSTVSGANVTLSATASDNVGVVGVQFRVDGSTIGTEDTTSPYSLVWDSTAASNGSHTVTAVARDAAGNSTTTTGVNFTVNNVIPPTVVANPTISPNGGSFTSAQSVSITTSTSGATIRYTLDGSSPSSTVGTIYTSPVSVSSTVTLKAIAYKNGSTDSSVVSATFTFTTTGGGGTGGGPVVTAVQAPVISPNGGAVPSGQSIVMSTATSGAVIHYTTNGSTPTGSSNIYYAPFTITSNVTVKAIATKAGMNDSTVVTATFTINGTQTPPIKPPVTPVKPPTNVALPVERTNFMCSGSKTVYYYYNGKKEAYSEAIVYEIWNGKNYSSVTNFDASTCSAVPDNGLVRLPNGTIVKVAGGPEIYQIQNNTARPFASFNAYKRDSVGKTTYVISLPYLHTYPRGTIIN